MKPGNKVQLLHNGEEYFPELLREIKGARHEIFLETYIFEADQSGTRVADALMEAARRDVSVHLMIDAYGSRLLPEELQKRMIDSGVQLLQYRPYISLWRFRRNRLRRLHRKLAVIDARVGFCGGINIIDDHNTPKHTPPRQDFAVRVEGAIVADMHAAARRLWTHIAWLQFRYGWRAARRVRPGKAHAGNQLAAFLVRDNFRHRHDIENAYLDAITSARREIVIACAYFFPGIRFRHALCDAAARGVRVVLLLQGRVEYVLLHHASRALYRQFLRAGIEIHEYMRSFMHAKVAVVDGHWATVGSSNIDPISFLLAREANVVIEDSPFASHLRQSLDRAMEEGSRLVQPERWRPSLAARVVTWMAYGMVRVLTDLTSYARGEER